MRKGVLLTIACVVAAAWITGCGDSTAPWHLVQWPTTLTMTHSDVQLAPTIFAKGDSVVATATLRPECARTTAEARGREGELVISIVDSTDQPLPCAQISGFLTHRVVVRPAPIGSYTVRFERRSYIVGTRSSETLSVTPVTLP